MNIKWQYKSCWRKLLWKQCCQWKEKILKRFLFFFCSFQCYCYFTRHEASGYLEVTIFRQVLPIKISGDCRSYKWQALFTAYFKAVMSFYFRGWFWLVSLFVGAFLLCFLNASEMFSLTAMHRSLESVHHSHFHLSKDYISQPMVHLFSYLMLDCSPIKTK